ncbi:hypothetical protein AB1Y20_010322 [Prymnesium parvum]|uniref:Sulfatase-modifying factor enzyme-like domain-containing protein n=1 Tax=Prymnesium parvum TaxID=97485 RepID=A0AB34K7M0_PRYPA
MAALPAFPSLPPCEPLLTGAWAWTDPELGGRPAVSDDSGSWTDGQLLPPPAAGQHAAWLSNLTAWRSACTPRLSLSSADDAYSLLPWTSSSFIHVQMHPYDLSFYSASTSQYTVAEWLAELRARYGGIDAALVWPTYPQLGVDDRNAYDMARSLPGGVQGVKAFVEQLHQEGVRVLWPFMPWDVATRYEGKEPESIVRFAKEIGADGINGDTLYTVPRSFWEESLKQNHPLAMQAELGGSLASLAWTTLGWGEAGGWSLPLSSPPPKVDLFKWLDPRRMTNICRRWDTNRSDALQHAFFNGIGYVAWENVWGIWNGITQRDGEALRRIQALLHFLGETALLRSRLWEPHAPTLQPESVFASRFPSEEPQPAEGCASRAAWTFVERTGRAWPAATPLLELPAEPYAACVFYDLYHGARLEPLLTTEGTLRLSFAIEAGGYGAVFSTSETEDLSSILTRMRHMTSTPLASFPSQWRPALQRRLPSPASPRQHSSAPAGAVAVAGSEAYFFRCSGTVIEPFDAPARQALGIDVQFEWEAHPRNDHSRLLAVPPFFIDRAPVSNKRFAEYLASTGYTPHDETNFLREWPDWRSRRYPSGNATVPVTGVSLAEARAFCSWAGGRLPSSLEWQYAAQAGDPSNIYPWGEADDASKYPAAVRGGRTPAPADSESLSAHANSLGLIDLIGNVWQYTSDEMTDDHSRFVILRGGSFYQPEAASNFENWYFGSSRATTRPGGAVRLDRHAKYFLLSASYERAATIGFRCAYDARPSSSSSASASSFVGSFFFYVFWMAGVAAALAVGLARLHRFAEAHLAQLDGASASALAPHDAAEAAPIFSGAMHPPAAPCGGGAAGSSSFQGSQGWCEGKLSAVASQ